MTTQEELYGEDPTPPISVTGTPCLDATWLATDAEAQAKILITKVLSPANLAALNATNLMSGLVEKATAAELESGASDKYPDASQMLLRKIVATGAIIGGDFSGNARGNRAIDIQTVRGGAGNVAGGYGAIAIGYNVTAGGLGSIGIGQGADTGSAYFSIVIGNGLALGLQDIVIGTNAGATGDYGLAIGVHSSANNSGVALGQDASANAEYSTAIGYQAITATRYTTNLLPIINRKDTGEPGGIEFQSYGGAEVTLMSKEVNLEVIADQIIYLPTFPSGLSHFYPTEVGIIATRVAGGVVTQPTVRFGWAGSPAGLVVATITTALNAAFTRERFTTLLNYNGQNTLLGGITIAGSGGTYFGRFYFKGLLIEDE